MSAANSGLESAGADAPGATRFGWIRAAILVLIGLSAIAALTPRVARVYPVSSDDATGVLEADAILHGNVLLHGWTLSKVSFVTTDLPFYVAAVAIGGMKPSLLRDVPVAIYIAAVALGAVLARGQKGARRPLLGMTALLVLLCLPAVGLAEFVTKGYIRVGTTLGLFAMLFALDVPPSCPVRPGRIAAFATILTLALIADTFALVIGVLPVLIVIALGARRSSPYGALPKRAIALAVLGSVAAARGLSWLIERLGGYRVNAGRLAEYLAYPDTLKVVRGNIRLLAENLPSLYRCDLPGEFTAGGLLVWTGCLVGPLLVIWALVRGFPLAIGWSQSKRTGPRDFVADVLWFSLVLSVAAFLATSIAVDRSSTRYMVPFVLSGAVLVGRVLAQRVTKRGTPIVALGVLGVCYAVTVADDWRKPAATDPAVQLGAWLDMHALRHGYGPFWDASIVTVSSGGRVAVRPIYVRSVSATRHTIRPMAWMADSRWFTGEPATFVVIERSAAGAYQFAVTETNCEKTFGSHSLRYEVGPYTVMIWGHDLRRELDLAP